MKRIAWLVVTFAFLVPSAMAAQGDPIGKGSAVLGGSLSWATSGGDLYENVDGDRYSSLSLSPSALFFVRPGLAIGGAISVEKESQGDLEATTLGIGPAVAYFFGDAESSSYPFIQGSVGYANISSSGLDGSGFGFSGSAGVVFMLSRSVGLTLAGTYSILNVSIDQVDDSFSGNQFGLSLGVDAFIY